MKRKAIKSNVKLGLVENWKQFALLVIVNGFVGGRVGLERTILPQLAEADYLYTGMNLDKTLTSTTNS